MQSIQKYTPFIVSALLMVVLLYVVYPHYQYYIDPDGVSYLTIAKRYATGDVHKAINAYWSPWSCWLTAMLIKTGMEAIPASVVINTIGAAVFLYISQSFFLKFDIIRKLQWLLNITLALFLCFAIFWQSFDDLWQCFFLLSTLRIMLSSRFAGTPLLWIGIGVTGALGYFAKAYSLPFFIINTLFCSYFIDKSQWLKISATAIIIMILCSISWICILHHKYGMWTTSTAGTLNLSWYLAGHPYWKQSIDLLLPPAYSNSPNYWEDPWLANGTLPHFWDSWHLFGRQVLRIGYNIYKLLVSMLQLSVFFPFTIFLLMRFFGNRKTRLPDPSFLIALSALLFPLGYLIITFESRYIWYLLPLSMVAGGLFVQDQMGDRSRKNAVKFLPIIFALSYLIYPAWGMITMYNEGAKEHDISLQLKRLNIHGSFTAITKPGIETQRMNRLAYFSGNQLYSIPKQEIRAADILREMRRYHVKYFFASDTTKFVDDQGNAFPEVSGKSIDGLKVFVVNP